MTVTGDIVDCNKLTVTADTVDYNRWYSEKHRRGDGGSYD
jgi:hypothetical protein